MIVREIIKHPELLETFDWFNDYHDTRLFLEEHHPDMLPQFLAAYLSSGAKWGKNEAQFLVDFLSAEPWHGKEKDDHRIAARATPAGKLLWSIGMDWWDTESSARRVAEHAASEIETLRTERQELLDALKAILKAPGAGYAPMSDPESFETQCRNAQALYDRLTEPPANIS